MKKVYCIYSFTLVNKKKIVRSFVPSPPSPPPPPCTHQTLHPVHNTLLLMVTTQSCLRALRPAAGARDSGGRCAGADAQDAR